MKLVDSWLATCTTTTSATATINSTIPYLDHQASDNGSSSDTPGCSSSSSTAASLQSYLSLQTLPSVPSLQKLAPKTSDLSVSYVSTGSFRPQSSSNVNVPITCLAVHRSNLLYAASGSEINVYERSSFAHLDAFNIHGSGSSSGSVKSVTFCDGKIFTSHQDGKIRSWRMEHNKQHKFLTALPTVNDRLRRFMLPRNYVDVRRHRKRLWIEHADAVTALAVNNGFVYSVSWDKYLKIWSGSDLRCLESVKAHEDAINAVAVAAGGTVYTGSADCRIRVWAKPFDENRHVLVATLEKHKSAVNALALNDDGSVLFSGACDRSILVWERDGGADHMELTGALRGHKMAILSLVNVSDLLFSGSADRTVRVWQRGQDGNFCCLAVLEGHDKPVKSLAAVREGGQQDGVVSVYSGSLDGEVKVWRVSVSRFQPIEDVGDFAFDSVVRTKF